MDVSKMSRKEWEKRLYGSQKDRYDKKIREFYQNAITSEAKAIIALMNSHVDELLINLEKERKENENASI
jgi:hypothetical protein